MTGKTPNDDNVLSRWVTSAIAIAIMIAGLSAASITSQISGGLSPVSIISISAFFAAVVAYFGRYVIAQTNINRAEAIKKEIALTALWLRPFDFDTSNIVVRDGIQSGLFTKIYADTPFEGLLTKVCLNNGIELRAFSIPNKSIGPSNIVADDVDWKLKAKEAISSASFVFIFPNHSVSTMWEVDYLVENDLLNKTYFIMPKKSYYVEKRYGGNWDKTKSIIQKKHCLPFPRYTSSGALFWYVNNVDKKTIKISELSKLTLSNILQSRNVN